MTAKTSDAQLKAAAAYKGKSLEDVRVLLGQSDKDVFDALQKIRAHYNGNRAEAVKQAILAHAAQLGL